MKPSGTHSHFFPLHFQPSRVSYGLRWVGLSFLFVFLGFHGAYAMSVDDAVARMESYLIDKPDQQRAKVLDLFWELETKVAKRDAYDASQMLQDIRRRLIRDSHTYPEGIIHDEHLGITFTRAKNFDIVYEPTIKRSLTETSQMNGYSVIINGSYFSRQPDGWFHSGLLYLGGNTKSPFLAHDNNITHVVCQTTSGRIEVVENADFFPELLYDCRRAFQTGPLVLRNNRWYSGLSGSTHDASAHTRTLMAVIDEEIWFIMVRRKMSLWDIGRYVMSMPEFSGSSRTLINLDGGSSIAYYSREYPALNIGISKQLPVLIGITPIYE